VARLLRNDATIAREERTSQVTYYHVELDRHAVVFAEGLAAESYLDTGNRGMFENSGEPLRLHPDFTAHRRPIGQQDRVARSCAPFVDDPVRVKQVWRELASRAATMGWEAPEPPMTTDDPDPHILVGGRLIRPVLVRDQVCTFVLPPDPGPVRLVSRAARPHDLAPWVEDTRSLGLCVRRLTWLRGDQRRDLAMDDPGLKMGWWGVEWNGAAPCRWTDGQATLPPLASGILEVAFNGLADYPTAAAEDVTRPQSVALRG
jgi:antigen 43